MTAIMPNPKIRKILHEKSMELHKYNCVSTWCYDENSKKIMVFTTRPGLWIGRHGVDKDRLQNEINEILKKDGKESIQISFIECDS